jgi:hypothetical protein
MSDRHDDFLDNGPENRDFLRRVILVAALVEAVVIAAALLYKFDIWPF